MMTIICFHCQPDGVERLRPKDLKLIRSILSEELVVRSELYIINPSCQNYIFRNSGWYFNVNVKIGNISIVQLESTLHASPYY